VKHLCHELSPTGLILYKHILNFNNHIKKNPIFFNSLIEKNAICDHKMNFVIINSGLSDSKTLKHLSLHNFIDFKIKASKMYSNEKNVIIPLQSVSNKTPFL
jgi:hypothetical protein